MNGVFQRHVIINFHGIGTPHGDVEPDEVPFWISEDGFIQILDRVVQLRQQGYGIRVTFDDGNASDIRIAAPALSARQMSADFFVLTGRIDEEGYLAASDLRELRAMGMGVGTHGRDHVDWRSVDESRLHAEIVDARGVLAKLIGEPIEMVSVPFGAYDPKVIARLKAEGYTEIHTSDGGTVPKGALVLPRTSIRSDMDDDFVERVLKGDHAPAPTLKRALSATVRRHLTGVEHGVPTMWARSLWTRLMLRRSAFSGSYSRLRRLYSIEDPWNMSSQREQYRFERTGELLSELGPRFSSILEIGSGEGHQSVHLAELTDRLCGLELSERAAERASSRCPQASFRVGPLEDLERVWPGAHFDLVVACEVLYYVQDLEAVRSILERCADRVFVSNYRPRSEEMRQAFTGPGWTRLPDITYEDATWECFVWEASPA
ncbi:MAG: polysaccharide deacetylase family protein [Microthrixaceae bacterium]